MVELARIDKVDLREVWANEAADFTPWLQKNIDQLGDALGMDLEIEEREAAVGTFSLDLLARDGGGRPVIIENQLGTTDHNHLGQILTYAAGHNASVVVWVAGEFRDEHRAALDFLNSRTGEDTEFFGVGVELWKIEGSRVAVNFDLVVTPNEWSRRTDGKRVGGTSERGEKYRLFFQALMDTLREEYEFTRARKAQPQNWYSFSSGTRWFTYGANFAANGRARVELYIDSTDREWNKAAFDELEQQKAVLESELEPLEWERLENRRASRISILRPGSIDDNQETLEEVSHWMIDRLLAFKRVFGPKLAKLGN